MIITGYLFEAREIIYWSRVCFCKSLIHDHYTEEEKEVVISKKY